MEVITLMALTVGLTMAVQALVRRIKGFFILRRLKKEGESIEKRIAEELESKKYVTVTL